MAQIGEKPIEMEFIARIIIDIQMNSCKLSHSSNLEIQEVYDTLLLVVKSVEELLGDTSPPAFLN